MASLNSPADSKALKHTAVEMAPPTYEQVVKAGPVDRLLDLLGSRSTQAVLADAVLTVVLSLYSSIHHLTTLTASHNLSLACSHLPSPAELPSSLALACARAATATAATHSLTSAPSAHPSLFPPHFVRCALLVLVIAKLLGAAWYLGVGQRDTSVSGARACDFVVTSIALHALAGFSSFLFLPLVPSLSSVVEFVVAHPLAASFGAGTIAGTAVLSIARAVKAHSNEARGRAVMV